MRANAPYPSAIGVDVTGGISKVRRSLKLTDLPDISKTYECAEAAVWHAIALVEHFIGQGLKVRARQETALVLRRDLPYVIHETALPNTQILVNRQYKPLGCNLPDSTNWVRYESFPQLYVHLTPEQIAQVACPPYPRSLFGDACPPWLSGEHAAAYLARLKQLYALLVREERPK